MTESEFHQVRVPIPIGIVVRAVLTIERILRLPQGKAARQRIREAKVDREIREGIAVIIGAVVETGLTLGARGSRADGQREIRRAHARHTWVRRVDAIFAHVIVPYRHTGHGFHPAERSRAGKHRGRNFEVVSARLHIREAVKAIAIRRSARHLASGRGFQIHRHARQTLAAVCEAVRVAVDEDHVPHARASRCRVRGEGNAHRGCAATRIRGTEAEGHRARRRRRAGDQARAAQRQAWR